MSITHSPLEMRRLSIPELLNSDTSETSSDVSTPSSPIHFIDDDPSLCSSAKILKQHEYPVLIAIKSLPVLRVARRHHHLVKSSKSSNRKTQGRPFTTKLTIQFYIHDDMNRLVASLLNNSNYKLIQFDHLTKIDSNHLPTIIKQFDSLNKDSSLLASTVSQIFANSSPKIFIPDRSNADKGCEYSRTLKKTIIYEPCYDYDNLNSVVQLGLNSQNFNFARVIRSNGGRFIKMETIQSPEHYDAEWFKRNVCFPRYKSGMKIHVIKCISTTPIVIYNDLRVLYWDLETFGIDYFMNKRVAIVVL